MGENISFDSDANERIHGYEIKRSIVFENDRGFALAENPNAPQPFVTWQFTENENGKRDYYWGHYTKSGDTATRDYELRIAEYQKDYGLSERGAYKYYSTQKPVDIGTFPKTDNGPVRIVNFEEREGVEQGHYRAWGYLVYDAPLTEKQIDDYELRAAPDNPDVKAHMREQAQVIGKWEDMRKAPDNLRFTSWYPDFGMFIKKDYVTPQQMAERYNHAMESRGRTGQRKADKKTIAEQLTEGAERAGKDNAARPTPEKNTDKDR